MNSFSRWLIPLPAVLFSLFPLTAHAEPVAGLNAVGYTITNIPPTKSDTAYTTCGNETENNINRNFDGEPFQQCPNNYFMVHYTGAINVPENETISFKVAADDGGTVKIGDTEFGTWNLKGCSWSAQTTNAFPAGSYSLDGWFFEATGNSCYMLAWNINGQGWQIVPDSAFTTEVTPTTTSSTSTTTTTLLPTTTTTESSTTTTTLLEPTSTSSSTTQLTTTTTMTTIPRTTQESVTTTTIYSVPITTPPVQPVQEPAVAVPTGTLPQPQEVKLPETTSPPITIQPMPQIDIPLTTDTRPPETVPPPDETTSPATSITVPFVPRSSTTVPEIILPDETTPQKELEQPQVQSPQIEAPTTESSLPPIIPDEITNEQITEIVSSPETLETLTVDQAEQLFEKLDVTELDNTELEAFTEAIQQAPLEIRKAFEKKINIFGSQFEDYIPAGSNIPVHTRRSLVAAGALIATGSSTRLKRK